MPYFVQIDNYVITWRQHKFNAEYLDGRIDLIQDDTSCCIIKHVPNVKFGYDVSVVDKLSAKRGWEKVEKLGHYNSKEPAKTFYELVTQEKTKEYLLNDKFTFGKSKTKKKVITTPSLPVKKTKRVENITHPEKERFDIPGLDFEKEKTETRLEEKPVEKEKKKELEIIKKPALPNAKPKPKISVREHKSGYSPFERAPSLVRDSESPVFTYTTPNRR